MQQRLAILLIAVVGALNACAPSGNRGVQFTEPAKCQQSGVELEAPTSPTAGVTPTASGYSITADGKATMKIICTPVPPATAIQLLTDGTAVTGLPITGPAEIDVQCETTDNKWLFSTQEIMKVSCTQS